MDSETLSNELSISKSFLAKILQALAKNGVLKSYKGVNGGFFLTRNPEDINMLEVMLSVESRAPTVFDCSSSIEKCPFEKPELCSIWPFLNKLQIKIDSFFKSMTLADVIEK
jgi:Rrf2 family protein